MHDMQCATPLVYVTRYELILKAHIDPLLALPILGALAGLELVAAPWVAVAYSDGAIAAHRFFLRDAANGRLEPEWGLRHSCRSAFVQTSNRPDHMLENWLVSAWILQVLHARWDSR